MEIFFLIIGTLAAFSCGKDHPSGHNIALAIMTIGCYACAVAMIKI